MMHRVREAALRKNCRSERSQEPAFAFLSVIPAGNLLAATRTFSMERSEEPAFRNRGLRGERTLFKTHRIPCDPRLILSTLSLINSK
jgi:hypothetical protein